MSASSTNPLYLCGPMASGKSALAVSLAKELGGEIVNGDIAQAFKGLSVLSGVPAGWKQGDVVHHLYGVLEPTEVCGPVAYHALAVPVIEEIQARGKVPIVVGGSGVYLKPLTHGPSSIPERDDALRAKFEERSSEDLAAELKSLDPEGAEATDLKNRRYLIRALEICLLSGQKMSVLKAEQFRKFDEISENLRGLYLLWDNENAKQRISSRTMLILEKGGIEEVKKLRETASETCRKTIGFSEIEEHLDGKLTLKECHKGFHTSTRRFAKRQRSWLKKEAWLEDIQCPFAFDAKVGSFRGEGGS
ncbi:MAG: tRNA (adenosine(37)-N6)-dimethylallyltransferase MiaA [Akkermansiaceae bacterium]|jgi:tRNA dimethylallyltransferase